MLLLDNSAWSRIEQGVLSEDRQATVADWYERGELGTCLPFMLEAGYSAASAADHAAKTTALARLPHLAITPRIERRAQDAQRELAEIGHHRLAPVDLIIAACAEDARAGVLHYDRDYDLIADRTSLQFHSEWLAPAGSL